jgi:hypothetical protein
MAADGCRWLQMRERGATGAEVQGGGQGQVSDPHPPDRRFATLHAQALPGQKSTPAGSILFGSWEPGVGSGWGWVGGARPLAAAFRRTPIAPPEPLSAPLPRVSNPAGCSFLGGWGV